MSSSNSFLGTTCGNEYPLDSRDWRCKCGGLFDPRDRPPFDASQIDTSQQGLWRYRRLLPLDPTWELVTLGEGDTPLLPLDRQGRKIHFKLEITCPTCSFKDRGASVLVTALRGLGVERIVEHPQAFRDGRDVVGPVAPTPTAAQSIAIKQPARSEQILAAVRATGGAVLTVTEEEIERTRNQLARQGFYVEETAAVAVADLTDLQKMLPVTAGDPVIMPLTGHGLKTAA